MYETPETIQARNKAGLESTLAMATTQFEALEKLASINAIAVKTLFEDTIANARTLAGARDMQEFVSLQSGFAQPAMEKALAYSKSVMEFATQANAEFVKGAERRFADMTQSFVSLLDNAARNAPVGTDVGVTAVKQMLAAANSAYDSFTKVTKQATEIAEANVATATETVKGLTKSRKVA